jgi:translation initiation factor IF-2
MRIHEFAKTINKSSKEIIQMLKENGSDVQNHLSAINQSDIDFINKKLSGGTQAAKPAEKAVEKAPAKPAEKPAAKPVEKTAEKQQEKAAEKHKIFTNNRQNGNSQGNNRTYTNDRNRQNDRPYNRDGQRNNQNGQRDGQRQDRPRQYNNDRPYNRDGQRNNQNGQRDGQRQDRPRQYNNDRPYNRDGQRNNQNGQRDGQRQDRPRQYNNDRPYNRDGQRNNQNGQRDGQRQDRPRQYNNDRPYNRDGQRDDKRQFNNDRRNTQGRRNDSRNEIPAADVSMPEKNRKDREDKFRMDRQDRHDKNRKNYEDGNGKKGKTSNKQLAQMQRPTKEVKPVQEEVIKVIELPETITIKELAEKMKLQPAALIKELFLKGQVVTLNTDLSYEAAEEIAIEHDIICEKEVKVDVIEELLKEEEENPDDMEKRPPVVCVMGHVDHGKTSLLDAIRKTNVTSGESGGITQHIGAYTVKARGESITFLDTPGHEAFTAMRMRGAQATDIAVLVVAADDGVMPQTVEAINHAKAAGIAIIVAVNKIDKPSANLDRVKQEMSEYELIAEDWGGDTVFVPVSAKTGEGIDTLLEMILLQAEMLELKANYNRKARGIVVEAKLDKGKGSVATVLVQKGILHVGDAVAAGSCYGKVRAMIDDKGRRIKEAGPSTPVEILGLNGVPNAGEVFVATQNEKDARSFADTFISESRAKLIEGTKNKMSLDDLFNQIKAGDVKELGIVVKADVQGSVEAVRQSLVKLSNEEVAVKIIHAGVGAINESDVSLAAASNAIIIGFNVRPDNQAKEVADKEKVDLRLYSVIYQAIADVEDAMKGMLDPVYEEKVIGHGEIRQIFKASGVGTIAGSYVLDGMFQRGCSARITREGEQIFEGAVASLKRFKDDVKEVKAGYECGLVFEKFNDIQEGDQVEGFIMVEVPRK